MLEFNASVFGGDVRVQTTAATVRPEPLKSEVGEFVVRFLCLSWRRLDR